MKLFLLFFIVLSGFLLGNFAAAITLQDLLNQPLPDIGAFMVRAWDFLVWLWDRIVFYTNIILNWSLDNILTYIWRVLVWAWNTLVNSLISGWYALLYFWDLLINNSFIDFSSVSWPWD